MMRRYLGLSLVALLWALPACDSANAAEGRAPTAAQGQNPLQTIEQPAPADTRFGGRVEEVARAGSYTYLRVACDGDAAERWVVTLGRGADLGEAVAVHNMGTKRNFRSKRLSRTFDELVFGIVRSAEKGAK